MEWLEKDKYNSFNSWKGLLYSEWYRGIVAGKFLPPIEVSIDPVNECNLDCFYCNSKEPKNRKVRMTTKHLFDLANFFKKWGIKAVCIAGGGEPTLHEGLGSFMRCLEELEIPVALITNGLFLDDEQIHDISRTAEWVGISVDSATEATYKLMKGHDRFKDVIRNISKLLSYSPKEVTYKFLLHPKNQHEVYAAIRTASHLGCHQVHIRPMSFKNFQKDEENYNISLIDKQIDDGFRDYGDKIKIFAVKHKYNEEMHVKFGFQKCLATPIMPIFQANGDVTLCIDRKEDKQLVLCKHEPNEILKFWGSQYHKDLIDKIRLEDCPKCTINYVNEIIEKAILYDGFHWRFP